MANVLNQIGSLTQLVNILEANGIQGFETMNHIRVFRNGYKESLRKSEKKGRDTLKQGITDLELKYRKLSSEIDNSLEERENLLKNELVELKRELNEIDKLKSFLKKVFSLLKQRKLSKRQMVLECSFDKELRKPFKRHFEETEQLQSEINDKKSNPEKWVGQIVSDEIREQEFILSVFKENKFLFYGAEGEERVVHELSKLPDTYVVINDYRLKFREAIYNRKNDDRIYSIQIDHVLVGPTGIYLIETKNWSKNSLENRDLFSPVEQLRRHSFAMFVLLNNAVAKGRIETLSDHWGDRKISPKNVILLTSYQPQKEYQYVKIMSISKAVQYISFGQPVFGEKEIKSLVAYLNHMGHTHR